METGIPAWLWEFIVKLIASLFQPLLVPLLAIVIFFLLRRWYLRRQAKDLIDKALKAVARERDAQGLWREGGGFWLKSPIRMPAGYHDKMRSSIPILMIATLKGGVGKTTLSANLAAHFAIRWAQTRERSDAPSPVRVLLIDLDFQGSLSTMTVSDNARFEQPSKANQLVSGDLGDGRIRPVASPLSRAGMRPNLTIATIPAYYDLAQAESRVLIEWLLPLSDWNLLKRLLSMFKLGSESPPRSHLDARYLLADALLHPQVQNSFDLVIIDAPPRLTTSHVQAMCASTHLLIPTVLDGLAGDAVARYLDQVAIHKLGPEGDEKRKICPYLNPIGVVGTLVAPNVNVAGPITELNARIAAARIRPQVFNGGRVIRQRRPYRDCAGDLIAYAATTNAIPYSLLRDEIDRLGYAIADMIAPAGQIWTRT